MRPSRPSSLGFSDGCKAALSGRIGPWILMWTALFTAALVAAFATGCARTVLVREGSPLRIGPETRARVYARVQGEWELSGNRVDLPEGWYLVPPSFVEEE